MPEDIGKEISELIGNLTEEPVVPVTDPLVVDPQVEEPVAEPPAGEPPVVEEPPVEEPPVEEPPIIEPPVEEPIVGEPVVPPAEEVPSTETQEELLERIRLLTARVEELTVIPGENAPETAQPSTPKEEPTPVPAPALPAETLEQVDFLGDLSIDDVLDTKDGLNKILNTVLARAVSFSTELSQKKVTENILLSVPSLVVGHIDRQTTVNKMVKDFYDVNKDLLSVRKTVGAVANTVHAEHPDWKLEEIFKEAGTRTRTLLGLKKQAEGTKELDPAFVKKSGAKGPRKTGTTIQDEIGEILT